jgi:Acetyltransferase (GNAT) family
MNPAVHITNPESDEDIYQVLSLQRQNLPAILTDEEIREQGFVTVVHDFSILKKMNEAAPHVIAKDGDRVIAYALAMLPQFSNEIEILKPMFEKLKEVNWNGKMLNEFRHFIMGQVCIDKLYRGKGIFDQLYFALRSQMRSRFEICITEVATRNARSLKAHLRVGFSCALHYKAKDGEDWELLVWDWK